MIRSIKNTLALVNRTPPEVISLIPDYLEGGERDKTLIKVTHVCQRWRRIFVSRPSLWTRLDCKHVEKTKVYIERSQISPLEIHLDGSGIPHFLEKALRLAVSHIGRLDTLSVSSWRPLVTPALLPALVKHFSRPVPLLKRLKIDLTRDPSPALPGTLFSGDLSSLRELHLTAALVPLSWSGLENLTIFTLSGVLDRYTILAHLLDFFVAAPRLCDIELHNSAPAHSNAPPGRIVSLRNLKKLGIIGCFTNSILLDHLSIPSGATVTLVFNFSGPISPIPPRIPHALDNLHNLSHITAVNFCFGRKRRAIQLNGPSGELYVHGKWIREGARHHLGTNRLLRFINRFDASRCRRLQITQYGCRLDPSAPIAACAIYQLLLPMGDLHTLTLTESNQLPFILTLNPDKNSDKIVLCPELEEITVYFGHSRYLLHIEELLDMAEARALRGVRLSVITIVCVDALTPPRGVSKLRKHVSRVECKFNNVLPAWDHLPERSWLQSDSLVDRWR